jgi:hypothetical protein
LQVEKYYNTTYGGNKWQTLLNKHSLIKD